MEFKSCLNVMAVIFAVIGLVIGLVFVILPYAYYQEQMCKSAVKSLEATSSPTEPVEGAPSPLEEAPCELSLAGQIDIGLTLGAIVMFFSGLKIVSDSVEPGDKKPDGQEADDQKQEAQKTDGQKQEKPGADDEQKRVRAILLFLPGMGFLTGLVILILGFYFAFFKPQLLYMAVYHMVVGFMMCIVIMMTLYERLKKERLKKKPAQG